MPKPRRVYAPIGQLDTLLAETATLMRSPISTPPKAVDTDPVRWLQDELGEDLWSHQQDVLQSVAENPRTAVPKCHSSGGTRLAAAAVVWWLQRWPDAVVYTLAPTWPQVRELLWRDIEKIRNAAADRGIGLGGQFYAASARWEFDAHRYALGRSTDTPERLQGPHGGHFLLIIDEASGFPENLEGAVEGMLASGETRLLMLSQPTKLSGMFWRACHRERTTYNVMPVDAMETPNVQHALRAAEKGESAVQTLDRVGDTGIPRPYLVKPSWVAERHQAWGESHPYYQIRVRGRFPKQASDSLISMEWIEDAMAGDGTASPLRGDESEMAGVFSRDLETQDV